VRSCFRDVNRSLSAPRSRSTSRRRPSGRRSGQIVRVGLEVFRSRSINTEKKKEEMKKKQPRPTSRCVVTETQGWNHRHEAFVMFECFILISFAVSNCARFNKSSQDITKISRDRVTANFEHSIYIISLFHLFYFTTKSLRDIILLCSLHQGRPHEARVSRAEVFEERRLKYSLTSIDAQFTSKTPTQTLYDLCPHTHTHTHTHCPAGVDTGQRASAQSVGSGKQAQDATVIR